MFTRVDGIKNRKEYFWSRLCLIKHEMLLKAMKEAMIAA